jgi:hypothetical protein
MVNYRETTGEDLLPSPYQAPVRYESHVSTCCMAYDRLALWRRKTGYTTHAAGK